jgi:predicted DsbA family dithiol-disulfide isomerase
MTMTIDIYHDTACPWCRIGKRHLKLALAELAADGWDEPVTLRYRTYFLNPALPPEGADFLPYMRAKGGHRIEPEQFFAAPRQAGAAVGLTFNFERMTKAPNTLLSHRLIALAPEDQREAVIDALYDAYFEHGQDIGDLETLLQIGAAHGMDAEAARAALQSEAARDEVLAEAEGAHKLGITGVPFFVIDERYAFSGAQPVSVMRSVLEKVRALRAQAC